MAKELSKRSQSAILCIKRLNHDFKTNFAQWCAYWNVEDIKDSYNDTYSLVCQARSILQEYLTLDTSNVISTLESLDRYIDASCPITVDGFYDRLLLGYLRFFVNMKICNVGKDKITYINGFEESYVNEVIEAIDKHIEKN